MSNEKGTNVDADTRKELHDMEVRINETITKSVATGFEQVEKHLSEVINKDIDHIKETQVRYASHHNEHFQNHRLTLEKFDSLKDNVHQEISKIKEMVLEEAISERTKDKLDEKNDRNKNTNIAFTVGLFTIISGVIGAIFYLASKL